MGANDRIRSHRGNDTEENLTNGALEPIQEAVQSSKVSSSATSAGNGRIRYRSSSSAELLDGLAVSPPHPDHQKLSQLEFDKMLRRPGKQPPESISDKISRFRGVLLLLSLPLLLFFIIFFLPTRGTYSFSNRKVAPDHRYKNTFAVIVDAGSSGSRVHVFCFDHNLDLVPIGKDIEIFKQLQPGLSAYADNPQRAAASLTSLLEEAEAAVPLELRSSTPVRVGATAGLRALEGDTSDRILQAVRDLLRDRSTLKSELEGVSVIDGTKEGSYQWVTINYLLGNLGKKFQDTVGIVDLGGGSVQMAYAIAEKNAASRISDEENTYVKQMNLKGTKYNLYVHSYLHYGLLSARAEILKVSGGSENPCILAGYEGSYKYGGEEFRVLADPSGSNLEGCKRLAIKALRANESTCNYMKCTFGGVWNGGGDGQKNLFVASFFFDRAAEAGFADPNKPVAVVHPLDFEEAAKRACQTKLEDAKSIYRNVKPDNLPYLCIDLVYEHTLLVDGFGLDPWQEITLVKQVEYRNSPVEAAWPLGSAIEAVSAL